MIKLVKPNKHTKVYWGYHIGRALGTIPEPKIEFDTVVIPSPEDAKRMHKYLMQGVNNANIS